MSLEFAIVLLIIAAAVGYAGLAAWRKARAFSPKTGCGADCGCGTEKGKAVR